MGAGGCFTLESPARGRLLMATLDGSHDLVLLSTLDLLQGVLLLHHPSRRIFVREIHLNVGSSVGSARRWLTVGSCCSIYWTRPTPPRFSPAPCSSSSRHC